MGTSSNMLPKLSPEIIGWGWVNGRVTNWKVCEWELNIISKKLIWYSENGKIDLRKDFRFTPISSPIIIFSDSLIMAWCPSPASPDLTKNLPFSSYHEPEFHKFLQLGCFDMSLDCFLKHYFSFEIFSSHEQKFKNTFWKKKYFENSGKFFLT